MILTIDAGNTHIKFGLWDGARLIAHWRLNSEAGRPVDEYTALLYALFARAGLGFADVRGAVIASVVPRLTPDLARMTTEGFGLAPLVVTGDTDIGIENRYQPPQGVGADRLADAVAAVHLHSAPCIVIDFGTATTYNAIDAPSQEGGQPVYLGGAISPGIRLFLDALTTKAAKLAPVDLTRPPHVIGDNTRHALQSGILYGYAAQIDGLVRRIREEMNAPDCPVIATGGHASLIAAETQAITHVDPRLTLTGLRLIYERRHAAQFAHAPEPPMPEPKAPEHVPEKAFA